MRTRFLLARYPIACAVATLFAVAPPAAAQKLVERVGSPIPYRVSLPAGAEIADEGDYVTAETDNLMIFVGAVDMVDPENPDSGLPVSEPEARRILTSMFMGSDSLLFGVIDQAMLENDVDLQHQVREFRTLGGERAAYVRGRYRDQGQTMWVETHMTVRDGVGYLLIVARRGTDEDAFQAFARRVHASFALPDGPSASVRR